jgi:hypothetical protein
LSRCLFVTSEVGCGREKLPPGRCHVKTMRKLDLDWLPPGTVVGPWRVVRGRNGGVYGVIFHVERVGQESAGLFAMKMARYAQDPRFEREGELLARTQHPQVPRLYERGEWTAPDGTPFPHLVMEWGSPRPGAARGRWLRRLSARRRRQDPLRTCPSLGTLHRYPQSVVRKQMPLLHVLCRYFPSLFTCLVEEVEDPAGRTFC